MGNLGCPDFSNLAVVVWGYLFVKMRREGYVLAAHREQGRGGRAGEGRLPHRRGKHSPERQRDAARRGLRLAHRQRDGALGRRARGPQDGDHRARRSLPRGREGRQDHLLRRGRPPHPTHRHRRSQSPRRRPEPRGHGHGHLPHLRETGRPHRLTTRFGMPQSVQAWIGVPVAGMGRSICGNQRRGGFQTRPNDKPAPRCRGLTGIISDQIYGNATRR
jgi:hypothetical protein